MINQLFSKRPDYEIIIKCLSVLGWDSLDDPRVFTRSDLESRNVLALYKLVIPDLREYYLPCKLKQYLSAQSIKSVITIQRQLLKTINYTIIGTECVINNKKNMTYKLISKSQKIQRMESNNVNSQCKTKYVMPPPISLTGLPTQKNAPGLELGSNGIALDKTPVSTVSCGKLNLMQDPPACKNVKTGFIVAWN
jgi:hypothetical protein